MRINRLRRRESITLLGCAVAVETRVTHPAGAVRARKQSYYCTAANGSKVPSKAAAAKSHSMTSSAAGNQCGRQVEARDFGGHLGRQPIKTRMRSMLLPNLSKDAHDGSHQAASMSRAIGITNGAKSDGAQEKTGGQTAGLEQRP